MYEAGDMLGGCRLLKRCGEGAFGTVFLAENATTGQRCALKILPKTGRQWRRELAALTAYQEKCRHANLMRVYHIGQDEGCIFYTMDAADPLHPEGDYLPDTLGNRLRERKRLAPEAIRAVLDEVLNGLEILHGAGLLHRDIKPDNILFVDGRAVLGDIGLVTETAEASFAGTRGFISPAVWKGERDYEPRDDLYALGMTLYCALTGNAPRPDVELPRSLTLSGCSDLVRAYNAVLDEASDIRTVADLRAVLKAGKRSRSKIGPFIRYGAALLLFVAAGFAAWRFAVKPPRGGTSERPQATPEKSDPQLVAELTTRMEQEWRDNCRERLKTAGRALVSPLNIEQGDAGRLAYRERRKLADEKAERRSREMRERIAEEEKRLSHLGGFAKIAVRYFGDVADDDAPRIRALKRHDAAVRAKIGDPGFLKTGYADFLIARSLGWKPRLDGKLGEFAHYVDALPPAERRLWRRRMAYERLRATNLSGGELLQKPLLGAATFAGVERRLAAVSGYLDTL